MCEPERDRKIVLAFLKARIREVEKHLERIAAREHGDGPRPAGDEKMEGSYKAILGFLCRCHDMASKQRSFSAVE